MKQYLSEAWIRSYTNDVQCVTECTRKNDYLSSFFFNNKMAPTTIFNLLLKLNSNKYITCRSYKNFTIKSKNKEFTKFSCNKKRRCNKYGTPSSLNIISCLSYTLYLLSSLNIIGWGSCTLYSLSS